MYLAVDTLQRRITTESLWKLPKAPLHSKEYAFGVYFPILLVKEAK